MRQQTLASLLGELQVGDAQAKRNPMITEKLRIYYLHDYDHTINRLKWNFYLWGDRPG